MPSKNKATIWQKVLGNKPTSTTRRKQLMKPVKKGQKSLAEKINFGGKYGRK